MFFPLHDVRGRFVPATQVFEHERDRTATTGALWRSSSCIHPVRAEEGLRSLAQYRQRALRLRQSTPKSFVLSLSAL